jgi:hypothetical protein
MGINSAFKGLMFITSCSLEDGFRSFGTTSGFTFNLEDGDTGYSETLITQSIKIHDVTKQKKSDVIFVTMQSLQTLLECVDQVSG